MIEKDLNKVLNYMKQYVENKYEHDSEPMLNWKDLKLVLEEIERLIKQIEEYQKALDETTSEKIDLQSTINKIRNYVYKPIDKEWDDILCIIEDGLRGSDKE